MLDFARERGIAIISDEVYGTLVYRRHARTRRPSSQIAEPDDAVFVDQQLLQALGDDGLAHRLAGASASAWRCADGGDRAAPTTPAPTTFRAIWRAGGAVAGGRCVPRRDAGALRARDATWCRISSTRQNRIRWMKPEGAFYGFLQDRRPEGQPRLRRGPGAPRAMSAWRPVRPSVRWAIRATIPICASASHRTRSGWPKGLDRIAAAL